VLSMPEKNVRRSLWATSIRGALEHYPTLLRRWRLFREWRQMDPLPRAIHEKLFERGRLRLRLLDPEQLGPPAEQIILPANYPLFAGEDTPLNDMLFLLNLAKGRKVQRILEVGTYRARTTFAFHLNCPGAMIVSYDIEARPSPFREALDRVSRVELRSGAFTADATKLRVEPKYDFIFVDGSHQFAIALEDSRLALEIVAPGGMVVWHDYRLNGYSTEELRVPEVLNEIRRSHEVFGIRNTTCAVYERALD
jgi:predicted O-methyltransferase YrrM